MKRSHKKNKILLALATDCNITRTSLGLDNIAVPVPFYTQFPDAHAPDAARCTQGLCTVSGPRPCRAALEGSDCQACEELPIKILRARLAVIRSGSPPAPASPPPAAFEPRAGRLQVTPSGGFNEGLTLAQRPHCPRTTEPPLVYVEESSHPPTKARELVSFGCEEDDNMSTNASDPDAWSEEEEGTVRARQRASGQEGMFLPRVRSAARSQECMFKCYVETDGFCCNKHKTLHTSPKELFSSTITRNISETSLSGDVWRSGSSGQPKLSMTNASVRRAAGTSLVVPLSSGVSPATGTQPLLRLTPPAPLSNHLSVWAALPSASDWVINTIKRGYTLQFARRPPRFCGVIMSEVSEQSVPLLRAEISSLLAKQAVEIVPEEQMKLQEEKAEQPLDD
ncbi:hypothetical protein G5714_013113 [Onychostoma macrolepis]|uniref:Uncharacterized protein n=1 Tax=Onychostoma macrolepis TaxID=369639 RepID=A0A7J6CEB9_9TELE|nr:hypothetical protein G5714_013113 [Onychostoma macrolepis]